MPTALILIATCLQFQYAFHCSENVTCLITLLQKCYKVLWNLNIYINCLKLNKKRGQFLEIICKVFPTYTTWQQGPSWVLRTVLLLFDSDNFFTLALRPSSGVCNYLLWHWGDIIWDLGLIITTILPPWLILRQTKAVVIFGERNYSEFELCKS